MNELIELIMIKYLTGYKIYLVVLWVLISTYLTNLINA